MTCWVQVHCPDHYMIISPLVYTHVHFEYAMWMSELLCCTYRFVMAVMLSLHWLQMVCMVFWTTMRSYRLFLRVSMPAKQQVWSLIRRCCTARLITAQHSSFRLVPGASSILPPLSRLYFHGATIISVIVDLLNQNVWPIYVNFDDNCFQVIFNFTIFTGGQFIMTYLLLNLYITLLKLTYSHA